MPKALSLNCIRRNVNSVWLIALFGVAYAVSQATILIILGPIADSMFKLQMTGVSAQDYLTVFGAWEATGEMAFYRAHFILDDIHWIWYAAFFTALLCRLFEKMRVPGKYDWFLLMPLGSGLLDWFENRIQHVFLSTQDLATIVDPLPLISTLASDIKWLLATAYIVVAIRLSHRYFVDQRAQHGVSSAHKANEAKR